MKSVATQPLWRYWAVAGLCSAFISFLACSIIFSVISAAKTDWRACYTVVPSLQLEHTIGWSDTRLCPTIASDSRAPDFERTYAQVSVSTWGTYLHNREKAIGLLLVFFASYAVLAIRAVRSSFWPLVNSVTTQVSPLQAAGLVGVAALAYAKPGIIDMNALGMVIEGLRNGVNFYYVSYLQGQGGTLPIFPYNPTFLFFLSVVAEAQSILDAMGLGSRTYSLLQMVIVGFYLWLAIELFDALKGAPLALVHRKLAFFLVLFNPLAIYYVFFLVQIDIISVAFIVVGLKRLCFRRFGWGFVLLYLGLVFTKPQHLLSIVPIIIAVASLGSCRSLGRYVAGLCALIALIALAFAAYGLVDGFYESLNVNPQAERLVWSTWWTMLSDAIVINRPVAMLCIACALLLFVSPGNLEGNSSIFAYLLLAIGTVYAFFQSSFAHTFGLAIFLYPAIVVVALSRQSASQAVLISSVSLGLLAGWGTGFVGDAFNVVGGSFFDDPALLERTFADIPYGSLINSIEYSLYVAFGFMFMLKILMDGLGLRSVPQSKGNFPDV